MGRVMSYDIHLIDQTTNETAQVPGHLMIGGTFKTDYHPETGTFTPALNTDAALNITYNYGHYYYEVFSEKGIKEIYGKSGAESIPILETMINRIKQKYHDGNDWITTKREIMVAYDENGNEIDPNNVIEYILGSKRGEKYTSEQKIVDWYEGPNSDYWASTAANALRPLYQLLALAKMRPDCIWDGD